MRFWCGVVALTLVVGCGGAEAIDGPATLEGEVRRYAGLALDGVTVSVGRKSTVTSGGGHFILTGLPLGSVEVLVALAGYEDVKQNVTLGAGTNTTAILMQPKPSGAYIDSIALQGPTSPVTITGPGSIRIGTHVYYDRYYFGPGQQDTTTITIATTGPLSATWELGSVGWRALKVSASGPGSGSVTVRYKDKTATIAIDAVDLRFSRLSLSSGYGCALTMDDIAWCWGGNFNGAMGVATLGKCNGSACQYGGNDGNATPLPVSGGRKFTQVATAGYACYSGFAFGVCGRTCALAAAGETWCWGEGFGIAPKRVDLTLRSLAVHPSGQAYLAPTTSSCGIAIDDKGYCFDAATSTVVANGMLLKALATGSAHSCAIDMNGDAYCWGSNRQANLGIGSIDTLAHPDPLKVQSPAKFAAIAVGRASSCALDITGTVLCWGFNGSQYSQAICSEADPDCVMTPRPVSGGGTYTAIAHSDAGPELCAMKSDGGVDCWTNPTAPPTTPALPEPAVSVGVSSSTSLGSAAAWCGVTQSGAIYCWSPTTAPRKFP